MVTFFPKDLTFSAAYSNSFYAHHQEIAEKGETPCYSYLVHKTIALLESVPGLRVLVAITELIIAKALMCLCCYCYKEEPPEELKEEKKDLASLRRDTASESLTPRSERVTPRLPREDLLADFNVEQAPLAPLPLNDLLYLDLPPENRQQPLSPRVPMVDIIEEEVPSPFAPPSRPPFVSSFSKPSVYSSMDQCYSFGIGDLLDLHDIMQLTSISPSFYLNSARQPALVQIRELAEKRTFMKVELPNRIKRIYEAMRDHGSVDVVPTIDTGTGYFYPKIGEMGSSFAVCQSRRSGQRGIELLVGGVGEGFVELPASQSEFSPEMRLPVQSIISDIFIMERYSGLGPGGWQLEDVFCEISELENSFQDHNDLHAYGPQIEHAIVSILAGTHPSIRCISKRVWEERKYWRVAIITDYDVPEGYSLMIRGNGPSMENWEKYFPMRNRGARWICKIPLCKGTEYKLYLRTPAGDLIAEDGPNRTVAALSDDLGKPITPPQFPSIEQLWL